MKNVAKCDTWCELQNPVNHRVFERKLRPTPSGRGHVCLGVTHRRPHHLHLDDGAEEWWADAGFPCALLGHAVGLKPLDHGGERRVAWWTSHYRRPDARVALALQDPRCAAMQCTPTRPQVRRDHPLSLSISISGGKETYEDSLSNGERTGNSPR